MLTTYLNNPPLGTIETEMRRLFSVAEDKDVRLWNRYMSNTYEHLSKKEITLQDAGLYQGQVGCSCVYMGRGNPVMDW